MNFWLLHCDFPSLPRPAGKNVVVSSQRPSSVRHTFAAPNRILSWIRNTHLLANFNFKETKGRANVSASLFCVARARFMHFPATLRVVVRYPHTLFPKITKEKTVVKFSFDID